MEPPSALYLECPSCGRAPHRVVRGRISRGKQIVLEATVRCLRCGFTRRETYREWAAQKVPLIVSHGDSSRRTELEVFPKEVVRVGDRHLVGDLMVEVTSIEAGGKRMREAPAEEIDALWSKRVDRVQVKFSLSKGRRTISYSMEVLPDEEFEIGDLVEFGRDRGVIHRIRTTHGLLKEGAARAEEIRRVYCKGLRGPRSGRWARRPKR
ncbi:MAG: HVO_0476 family zinc finger protein [Thermoplasmata archaeon]